MVSVSAIDHVSGGLGDAHLGAVRVDLETDAGGFPVLVGDGEVAQVNGRLAGVDAGFLARGLPGVATHEVEALNDRALIGRNDLQDLAGLALVLAGQHDDGVVFPDLGGHYSTSGASEMIFMWFLARSSRGTGPKMRVPIGSAWLLISTAAFLSKRITVPSARRMSLAVRTTTAFITWPFLTRPRGIASLTETTITSPTEAYLRCEPPSTLMHMTRRAPELSATSRLDCI